MRAFRSGDWQKVLSMDHLSGDERRHLLQVYSTLLGGVFCTGFGVRLGNFLSLFISHNVQSLVSLLVCVAASIYVAQSADIGSNATRKGVRWGPLAAFATVSTSIGVGLSSLITFVALFHMGVLVNAIMAAASIFAALSAASLLATRRSLLWVGAIGATLMTYVSLAMMFNFFFRSAAIFDIYSIGSLFAGLAFTIYDTQMMLERAHLGDGLVVPHALQLYTNLIKIFVHLLRVLLERDQESRRRDSRRKNY